MNAAALSSAGQSVDGLYLRAGRKEDASACGQIIYGAFAKIATAHAFPPDFPDTASAIGLASVLLEHPRIYSIMAERDGRVIGSNFLHEQGPISGVGPITISPEQQDASVGRRLMQDVLRRADSVGAPGVRLVQAAYHSRSLSLYTKLGFEVREPLALMQGPAIGMELPGHRVRAAERSDIGACNRLSEAVHGHDRHGEVEDAVAQGTATVVVRNGRVTAYATAIAFLGHAVAETNGDLEALIAASPSFGGPGFLLPMRNSELFRWCLGQGLRVVQPMALMSRGLYNEPRGTFLPSVLF